MNAGTLLKICSGQADPNFLISDGRTIGNASSGADVADDSMMDLFYALWGAPSGLTIVVNGGRGASAAADWAANKSLTTPQLSQDEGFFGFQTDSNYEKISTLQTEKAGLPAVSNPSRTLNSAFIINASKPAIATYSVEILCSLSLTSGQKGTAYLQYADDSAFTTNVVDVSRVLNGNEGVLAVGLALNQTLTQQLNGVIPAGKYVRILTTNETGSPSFNLRAAQEVLL